MPRPWIILFVLLGGALLGFEFVQRLYMENSGSSHITQLKAEISDLEERLEAQKKENQRLLLELKDAIEKPVAATTPEPPPAPPPPPADPTLESMAVQVAQLRKLEFKRPLQFVGAPFPDIAQRTTEDIQEAISEDEGERRQRAYSAMGFVTDPFDYRWALSGLRNEQEGWFYDAPTATLYTNGDTSLKLPEARSRMVRALMEALLEQNYGLGDPGLGDSHNEDRAMAAFCLLGGDAQLVQLHYSLSDVAGSSGGGSAGTPPPFYEAPIFMRERQNFPYDGGMVFHEAVRQQPDSGKPGFLDRVYTRLPVSTAEIMHPEELYFAPEPFSPIDFEWDDLDVAGESPIASNVAGELNVMLLMKVVEAPDIAEQIGHGWRGDRYLIYPGAENASDHVFWRSTWATAEDAREFASGIQKSLTFRFSIPVQKRYLTDAGFIVDDPARTLRIRTSADGKTVQVVNASSDTFADALEAKLGLP
ncbi:MAG: hypothetical protein R3F19_16450 [Verrucomicrobiales bacterium]